MNTNTDPVRALIGEMTEYLDQQVDPELDVIAKWRDRLEAARQPGTLDPRSTHRVFRNDEWLPCYCAATRDHWIGGEVMADGQQPAAPSATAVAWVTRGSKRAHVRWFGTHEQSIPHGTKLYAAPQQPAAGEEIMVNTPYDVFTLPLQPSGLSSGPRFVVHVPGPQQPAAVDEGMVEQRARELLEAECGRPLPLDVPVCAAHSAVVAALIAARAKEDRNG